MSRSTPPAVRRRLPEGSRGGTAVVSSLDSDAHTWNLVFLQLLLEESGFAVTNLGPCVPTDLLVATCCEQRPLMVVLSSVNGHGFQDGLAAISALRARDELAGTLIVIGGKLGVSAAHRTGHARRLLAAGYDAVYDDDAEATEDFRELIRSLGVIGP